MAVKNKRKMKAKNEDSYRLFCSNMPMICPYISRENTGYSQGFKANIIRGL